MSYEIPSSERRDRKTRIEVDRNRQLARFQANNSTQVDSSAFGAGSHDSSKGVFTGNLVLNPEIHIESIEISWTGASGTLNIGDIVDTTATAWQGKFLHLVSGNSAAGTGIFEPQNSTAFTDVAQTLNVSTTWTGATYTTSTLKEGRIVIQSASVIIDTIDGTDPTLTTIYGASNDGQFTTIKPKEGKTLTIDIGGNIDNSIASSVNDSEFTILQFHEDNITPTASGSWTFASGGGGSGSSSNAIKQQCRVATTGNNVLHPIYNEVIDDITTVEGDRILVKEQTTQADNGIYVMGAIVASAGTLTRATDFDDNAEVIASVLVAVEEGTINSNSLWMLASNNIITVGTSALVFTLAGDNLGDHTATQDLDMAAFNIKSNFTPTAMNQFRIVFDAHDDSDTFISNSTTVDRISFVSNDISQLEISPTGLLLGNLVDLNTQNIVNVGFLDINGVVPTTGVIRIPNSGSINWDRVTPNGFFSSIVVGSGDDMVFTNVTGGVFQFFIGDTPLQVMEINTSGIDMQLNTISNTRNIVVSSNTSIAGFRDTGFGSDPSTPNAGELYYNTGTNLYRFYNGTIWADINTPGGLNSLTDVTITSASIDEHLEFNGSAWVDVSILTLANNTALRWRNAGDTDFASITVNASDEFNFNPASGTSEVIFNGLTLKGVNAMETNTANRPSVGFLRQSNATQHVWRNAANTDNAFFEFNASDDFVFTIAAQVMLSLDESGNTVNVNNNIVLNTNNILPQSATNPDIGATGNPYQNVYLKQTIFDNTTAKTSGNANFLIHRDAGGLIFQNGLIGASEFGKMTFLDKGGVDRVIFDWTTTNKMAQFNFMNDGLRILQNASILDGLVLYPKGNSISINDAIIDAIGTFSAGQGLLFRRGSINKMRIAEDIFMLDDTNFGANLLLNTGTITNASDSTYDIGTTSVRYANIYSDVIHTPSIQDNGHSISLTSPNITVFVDTGESFNLNFGANDFTFVDNEFQLNNGSTINQSGTANYHQQTERAVDPAAGTTSGKWYVKVVGGLAKPYFIGDGTAAIDLTSTGVSSLEDLTDTNVSASPTAASILVHDGVDSWDDKVMSGDVALTTAGVAAIQPLVIVDGDVNASASIAVTKIAGTAVNLSSAQTITGVKSFDDDTLILLEPSISGTNTFTFSTTAISANRIITIPALTTNDTFVFQAAPATLTNKTLDDATNTITGIYGITGLGAQTQALNMNGNTINDARIAVKTISTVAGFRDDGFASDPTSPLEGELYYNTTDNKYKFYNGTAWVQTTSFIGFSADAVLDMNGFNINDARISVQTLATAAGFRDIGVSTDPSSPLAGELYYNTTDNKYRFYNGTVWDAVGQDTSFIGFTADATLNMNNNAISTVGRLTMNERLLLDKGGDVASGTALSLGFGGNIFDVTGTTTINTISPTGWQAGAVIHLQFDGALTVTHNSGGTNDILLGNQSNMTTSAGDVLTLFLEGTDWVEVSRSVVSAGGAGDMVLADVQTVTGAKLFNTAALQINNPATTFQYQVVSSAIAADRIITLPLLGAADTFVFEDFAQTLTGKSIDSDNNTITNIVNADIKAAAAIDITKISGTAVNLSSTQTITGAKTFNTAALQINNPATTFQYQIISTAIAADRILTLPLLIAADTFVFEDHIQTLVGKTMDGDLNTFIDINETQMNVSVGASGTALTSNGVGSPPTYQSTSGATTELDNLGTTSVNANINLQNTFDIIPENDAGSDLGSSALSFGVGNIDLIKFNNNLPLQVGEYGISRASNTLLEYNVPTGTSHKFEVQGATVMTVNSGGVTLANTLVMGDNNITGVGATMSWTDGHVITTTATTFLTTLGSAADIFQIQNSDATLDVQISTSGLSFQLSGLSASEVSGIALTGIKTSPLDDQVISDITFNGHDSVAATREYAKIECKVTDKLSTNIEGDLDFYVTDANSSINIMRLDGSANELLMAAGGDIDLNGGGLERIATFDMVTTTSYSVSNAGTDRTYNADATSIGELADVLATLLSDLKVLGLLT